MKDLENFNVVSLDNNEMVEIKGGTWQDFLDGNADGVGAGGVGETGRNFSYWLGYAVGLTLKQNA